MDRQELLNGIIAQLDITVPDDEIRLLANRLWLDADSPSGDGESFWLVAEAQLLVSTREKIAKRILNQAILPVIQESAASIQDEAKTYTNNAIKVLQKEQLLEDQLVLPEGVRFHRRVGHTDHIVIEQQPMVRTLLIDAGYHENRIGQSRYSSGSKTKEFRIALPYVIYHITLVNYQLSKFHIAFRTEPLKTLKDKLSLCVLPNSNLDGTVCCPFAKHKETNIVDAISHIIGFYWQSQFCYCLHKEFPSDPAFKTWDAWEKASETNPLFVLNLKWPQLEGYDLTSYLGIIADYHPSVSSGLQDLSSKFIKAASDILTCKEITKSVSKPVPKSVSKPVPKSVSKPVPKSVSFDYDDDDI